MINHRPPLLTIGWQSNCHTDIPSNTIHMKPWFTVMIPQSTDHQQLSPSNKMLSPCFCLTMTRHYGRVNISYILSMTTWVSKFIYCGPDQSLFDIILTVMINWPVAIINHYKPSSTINHPALLLVIKTRHRQFVAIISHHQFSFNLSMISPLFAWSFQFVSAE